jgi:Ca2+-binding RTX toxin-like protein
MASIFDVQGFGALSEWNGQFSSLSAAQAFQTIASLGSNSIALTARIWTQSKTSTSVFADPAKTESDTSLLAGFQAAHAAGLSVVFKAAISPLDGTPTHALAPSDAASFFASYKTEIVHLATIAQQGGVETFVIGNEMGSLTGSQYRAYWTDIISAVRQVYQGELTYAAATDEASKVSFWDQLDTIGVNTYPPLTSSTTPTVQDLIHAWSEVPFNPYYAAAFEYKSPVDFLHSLSLQYNKPVLMTEVGYRSIDGTAISPGSWTTSGTANESAQADAYNAFFQVWTANGGSWFKGVELWQWDLNNQYNSTGYSVMGKSAEALVSQYFNGQGTVPGLTVNGSPVADVIDLGSGNNVINGGLGDDVIRSGAGDDVIVGGPATTARLSTTAVTLTGWGSVVSGIGAQAQILVNGKAVSGIIEFHPATDPSGYQTYTVTFDNTATGPVTSIDINLVNATPGRALHVKDFSINGVALTPSDGTNASAPGTFDLYVRTIHFDTTNHQDWFVGASTDSDVIDGGAGNDVITGGAGNDLIDGGADTDTAVYSGNRADYSIALNANGSYSVTGVRSGSADGSDTVLNVEIFQFADGTISVSEIANDPPVITSNGSGDSASVPVAENTTAVTTITATDPDAGQTLSYAIIGGADASRFTIDATTGALAFAAAPDFEAPSDADGNNVYDVTVEVSDGSGGTDTQAIAVAAQDVIGVTITGNNAGQTLTGTGEKDSIFGLGGSDTLLGLAGNDVLDGAPGSDLLDGGAGNDRMAGGAGNDAYVVDSSEDVVVENAGEGTDTIRTALAAFALAGIANVENLTFVGTGDFTGTGNALANTITGGVGNDVLDGAEGADRLVGLDGNDTYFVNNSSDVVVEAANAGTDAVMTASAAYTLSANVENLTYVGTGSFNGAGNGLANIITGGSNTDTLSGAGGNDTIIGLGGNDTLGGGAGDDTFVAAAGDGNDSYVGNGGSDTYSLAGLTVDAIINLATGTATSSESGADTLISIENVVGGSGQDTITASTARNAFTGGAGNDTFVFASTAAAGIGTNRDLITDFTAAADRIDVSGIDANGGQAGNPEFVFVGEIANVVGGVGQLGRGQLGYHYETDANGIEHTIVEGSIDADAAAEFQIDLVGRFTLSAGDFVL